jgi:sensor c-di-GMP phosphodiesterase-like protein
MKHTEIITAITALFILLGALGAYVWWHQGLLEKRTASEQLTQEIQQTIHKEGQVARLANKSEQLVANETLIATHLVRVEDVVFFLRHIEEVGRANNVLIEITSVSDTAEGGEITVSLKGTGSFSGVMKTVGMLEHDQYTLSAKNINVRAESEGGWELVGIFTALTYLP